ncbi:DJ-1/PfpI family protein [Winogradskyella wandonensis]|uniref:DJ-1/PfpI family protein n=1 Tax=Winogradskyella wandonensis TaxID=1442586 RepID=A0A4R1KU32_9FLAO|nr:DJ-1/PfpI family protein [Winogradskyella wandonensis]TCK68708.1 DJ-1/PfpI family protein [Winogradskyella wandonensis]
MKKLLIVALAFLSLSCNDKKETEHSETDNTFVEKQFPKLEPKRYNVAFLIMDGTYNTELTAPYDIFQHTIFRENIKAMNVFTVANTDDQITTFEGMRILPDYNYISDKLPKIDILVVPSAEHHLDSDLDDKAMIDFVKKVDKDAQFVTSHCDGAFVLAEAGLLKEKVSTTFPSDIDKMRERYPDLLIRKDVLFVHDGKYITSAGGAKSFEAALYLCEYLYGKEIAQSLAGGLVIDWNLDNVPHIVVE